MKTSPRQFAGGSSGMHPERRVTLDSVRADYLIPHPLSVKIYGMPEPSEELLVSIEKFGLLQPIVLNDYQDGSYEVIAGNTRVAAWQQLRKQGRVKSWWIPVKIVHVSELEAEQLIIESNRQREKTPGQKARETAELYRIEQALAAERERAGTLCTVSTQGRARDIVAAKTSQSPATVTKQVAIVTQAESGNPAAKEALKMLDTGSSVASAYRLVTANGSQERTMKHLEQLYPEEAEQIRNGSINLKEAPHYQHARAMAEKRKGDRNAPIQTQAETPKPSEPVRWSEIKNGDRNRLRSELRGIDGLRFDLTNASGNYDLRLFGLTTEQVKAIATALSNHQMGVLEGRIAA